MSSSIVTRERGNPRPVRQTSCAYVIQGCERTKRFAESADRAPSPVAMAISLPVPLVQSPVQPPRVRTCTRPAGGHFLGGLQAGVAAACHQHVLVVGGRAVVVGEVAGPVAGQFVLAGYAQTIRGHAGARMTARAFMPAPLWRTRSK